MVVHKHMTYCEKGTVRPLFQLFSNGFAACRYERVTAQDSAEIPPRKILFFHWFVAATEPLVPLNEPLDQFFSWWLISELLNYAKILQSKMFLCKSHRRYEALYVPSRLALIQDIISFPHWPPIPTLTRLYNDEPSSRGRPKLTRVPVHSTFSLGVMPQNATKDLFHAVVIPVPINSGIFPAFELAVKSIKRYEV